MLTVARIVIALANFFALSIPAVGQGVPARIETIDGQSFDATLHEVAADESMRGDGLPAELRWSQVLSVDFRQPVSDVAKDKIKIALPGRGWLIVEQPLINGETIEFQSPAARSPLPLDAIRGIVWTDRPEVQAAFESPLTDNDQIIVSADDGVTTVAGLLEAVTGEKVQVNYQGQSRMIGIEKVLAVVLAQLDRSQTVAQDQTLTRLQLTDGSIISGRLQSFNPQLWSVELSSGQALVGESGFVSRVDVQSSRQMYLSELEPTEVYQRSYFGADRPWQRNQNLVGQPLSVRDPASGQPVAHRTGYATRALTRMMFENPREFDHLKATVGLDPELGMQGDCEVLVRADGIELWKQRVNSTTPSHRVDLDISGMRQIELVVQAGEQFDLGDFVNWCSPQFLKTK